MNGRSLGIGLLGLLFAFVLGMGIMYLSMIQQQQPAPTALPLATAMPIETAMPTAMPTATTIVMVVPTDVLPTLAVSTPDFWGTLAAMQTSCCPVCSPPTSPTSSWWFTSTPTRTPRPWRPSPTPCVNCNLSTPTPPVIPTNTPCVTCNQATPTPPVIPTNTPCITCNQATPTPP